MKNGFRNEAVQTNTYIPLQVTEVNNGKQVTVYNQAPSLRARVDNLYFNTDTANSDYNGGDITINKRLSNKWALNGGASFGKTLGDTLSQDLNNPNSAQFRRGLLGNDPPWSYRMPGVYQFPQDVFVSGTWQYYQGFPELPPSPSATTRCATPGPTTLSSSRAARRACRQSLVRLQPQENLQNVWMAIRAASISQHDNEARSPTLAQLGPTYGRISNIQRGADQMVQRNSETRVRIKGRKREGPRLITEFLTLTFPVQLLPDVSQRRSRDREPAAADVSIAASKRPDAACAAPRTSSALASRRPVRLTARSATRRA